jgi:AraC family transcriptional regulator
VASPSADEIAPLAECSLTRVRTVVEFSASQSGERDVSELDHLMANRNDDDKRTHAMLQVLTHRVDHGSSLNLSVPSPDKGTDERLLLVIGGGRGCLLKIDGEVAGIWMPIRGRLHLHSAAGDSLVTPREILVTEPESRVCASGRGNALWASLVGTSSAWRNALCDAMDFPTGNPMLLPARHVADREFRRRAINLVRLASSSNSYLSASVATDLAIALQQGFASSISRCPGRTFSQRRLVFVRLQRVRNYIAANCHLDLDDSELANMANYSQWHFIRLFRDAYQETPHAFLLNQRLMRARRLLDTSPLAITEIARASGFENRSVFSRLFHKHFGVTALSIRQNGNGVYANGIRSGRKTASMRGA